jgi:hypothetical protein
MMQFFSDETISPRQRSTPERFLVCADAVLARTGTQVYAGYELPELEPGADGLIPPNDGRTILPHYRYEQGIRQRLQRPDHVSAGGCSDE